MQFSRALGLPVPRVLSFAVLGRYYSRFGDTNSILMTRLPGVHLTRAWDTLSETGSASSSKDTCG